MSELLPHTAKIVDELCIVRSMHTEAINHDPAITFFQTGSQQAGRPSMGAWLSYGLGSENENLPSFIVLISRARGGDQPLYSWLWGSGFLPSQHQGVQFRERQGPGAVSGDPDGLDRASRRRMLDTLRALDEQQHARVMDPEIDARIAQYEMAYRMQTGVPDAMDLTDEPDSIVEMYGPDAACRAPSRPTACWRGGWPSAACASSSSITGWDQHGNLPDDIQTMTKSVDQASAALVKDLKQRGLLDDTLVIWGGEFGRTNYSQGKLTTDQLRARPPSALLHDLDGRRRRQARADLRRDRRFGYNVVRDPVHVHDFQATLLHLLGIDHEQLTFKIRGAATG